MSLNTFLAASARLCEGAPADRLFNSASPKQGTGFKHVEVFELPRDAVVPFPGKPRLAGDLVLPVGLSQLLQGRFADNWTRVAEYKYELSGGTGIGKTVLLNVLIAKAFATLPGRDLYLDDEDAKAFFAILRSKEALQHAGITGESGETYVVQRIRFRGGQSRAEQAAAIGRAFPTFGSEESIYFYNPAANASDGSSQPFDSEGITIAAGSLKALSGAFKEDADDVPVPDAAPEVFVEQAAAVLTSMGRVFSLKALALVYCMWGASLRAALLPTKHHPNLLFAFAKAAGAPALAANAPHIADLRNRLVGSAAGGPVLRPTVFRGVNDEDGLLAQLFAPVSTFVATVVGDMVAAHGCGVPTADGEERRVTGAGTLTTAVTNIAIKAAAPSPVTLGDRIKVIATLWTAAHDDSVSRDAFFAQWRALLKEHVPPPAFLTQPPAWVDAETGKLSGPREMPALLRV